MNGNVLWFDDNKGFGRIAPNDSIIAGMTAFHRFN